MPTAADIVVILIFCAACPLISFGFVASSRPSPFLSLENFEEIRSIRRFDQEWRILMERLGRRRRRFLPELVRQARSFSTAFIAYKARDVFGFADLFATGVAWLLAVSLAFAIGSGFVTVTSGFGI